MLMKEKEKDKKYGNNNDIWGLGLECLGGVSPRFKEQIGSKNRN